MNAVDLGHGISVVGPHIILHNDYHLDQLWFPFMQGTVIKCHEVQETKLKTWTNSELVTNDKIRLVNPQTSNFFMTLAMASKDQYVLQFCRRVLLSLNTPSNWSKRLPDNFPHKIEKISAFDDEDLDFVTGLVWYKKKRKTLYFQLEQDALYFRMRHL